ncbi:MAG: glycosyltransferase family 39 protein [Gammaproteobacteria bacterium]|nr:glycosyltransferase family 39 protein [Gammaproteobacteria bacterium]
MQQANLLTRVRRSVLADPWIVLACLVAVILAGLRLDHAALWFDEVLSVERIRLPWAEMMRDIFSGYSGLGANNLPLYFVALKAWVTLAGESVLALRAPGVALFAMTVGLTGATVAELASRRAARCAAWITAISPFLLHHSQEARMYPLLAVCAAWALLATARFVMGSRRRPGIGFVLACFMLLATHYYAIFFVSAVLLTLLILRPQTWSCWLPEFAVTSVGILGVLLTSLLISEYASGQRYAIDLVALPGMVWSLVSGYCLLPSSEELHSSGLTAVMPFLPIALISVIPLVVVAAHGFLRLPIPGRWLIGVCVVLPIVMPVLASVLVPTISINPRYATPAAPALLALLGAGMTIEKSSGWWIRGASVAVAAVLVLGSYLHIIDPGHGRMDIRAAGDWLSAHAHEHEPILVTSDEMRVLAEYHWPERPNHLYPDIGLVVTESNVAAVAAALPFDGADRKLFVFGRAWISDPAQALLQTLSDTFDSCGNFAARGVKILCVMAPTPVE